MNMKKVIAVVVAVLFLISFSLEDGKAFAYKREKWKLSNPTMSYKWGASLESGRIKTGWKDSIASWESKTSSNIKINLFYHADSVNFLTRFTEKDSNYFGKMNTTYNSSNIVTKFAGYLNDYAVKNSNVAQSAGVHELGHAFGIAHNSGTSIMNSSRDRNSMITPQTDDVNGVKSIY
ncbi:matrixin family metalloprotease (plasmid) [Exiguobacterium acetylicum]